MRKEARDGQAPSGIVERGGCSHGVGFGAGSDRNRRLRPVRISIARTSTTSTRTARSCASCGRNRSGGACNSRKTPRRCLSRNRHAGRQEQTTEEENRPHDLDADETYLLFPKESLAPDAPPLLHLLLAEPTLDNARRYVRWYARRTARLQAVQALIELAGSELEAKAKAGGEDQR